ncbi:MAG: hypothetical protein GTO14_24685 [Anaerolineales bacterium]|nr:hypothetical protein [Anaerolineales bacterium]
MLTFFTSSKPFGVNSHIDLIQRNAIESWKCLGEGVEVLLIGDELGMAEVANELGITHLKDVRHNEHGTPYVSSVFSLAREAARHPLLCFVNADIIFLEDLLTATRRVRDRFEQFLILGQRWNLNITQRLDFEQDWLRSLRRRVQSEGQLHGPLGSDYFVFERSMFTEMPDFAIGRPGWDNWTIFAGRAAGVPVVDATEAITVIHQDHDYSHLPGGRPPYGGPESKDNLAAAGGMEVIFMPTDATWTLTTSKLSKRSWMERGVRRSMESGLIARFGAGLKSYLVRLLFHPGEAVRYYGSALWRRIRRLLPEGSHID